MEIYVSKDGAQEGPFSVEQIVSLIQSGKYLPTDLGWHEGIKDWVQLSSLMPKEIPKKTTPPPPPLSMASSPAQAFVEGLNLKQAAADVLKKGGAAFDTFVDGVANVAGVEKAEGNVLRSDEG